MVNLYEVKGNIYITSCKFQAANSPSVIHVYSSVVTNGTIVYITKCMFRDSNAALHVIHLQEFDSVSISNCIFQSSFRSIGVYSSKDVVIENCIFQDAISDLALDDSYIIKLYVMGSTNITNCQFRANLYASSAIEQVIQNSTGTVTYITGCVFQDNIVTTGIIDILASVLIDDIYIANCTFWNNTVSYHGGIITVADLEGSNSNFSVTDCTFQHNSVVGVGVTYLSGNTNLYVTNCSFQDLSTIGSTGSVILYGSTSGSIVITDCTFKDSSLSAGAVMGINIESYVHITNCLFQNLSSYPFGIITMLGSIHKYISNCTFQSNVAGGIIIALNSFELNSIILVTRCTFQDSYLHKGEVIASVPVSGSAVMHVINCTFHNMSSIGSLSSAIGFSKNDNIHVIDCTFINRT